VHTLASNRSLASACIPLRHYPLSMHFPSTLPNARCTRSPNPKVSGGKHSLAHHHLPWLFTYVLSTQSSSEFKEMRDCRKQAKQAKQAKRAKAQAEEQAVNPGYCTSDSLQLQLQLVNGVCQSALKEDSAAAESSLGRCR